MINGFYAGRPRDGDGYVMVINDNTYTWNRSKYLTNLLKYIPVGHGFTAEGGLEDDTLTLKWSTLEWTEMVEEIPHHHILNNAAGMKARTIKTIQNKVDTDNFRKLTLEEIRFHMLCLDNASQKAALMARVMAEMNY